MKSIFILIPTYNEMSNIEKVLNEVMLAVPGATIVILDDHSPDKTWEYVQKRALTNKQIILSLSDKGKQGLGKAYLRGFALALERKADYIVQMDADLSHNPQDINDMVNLCQYNDLVIGSRYKSGVSAINWPMRRILLSYCANLFVSKLTGTKIKDCTSGFKCFSAHTLSAIRLDKVISDGYVFQVEMNLICEKLGFKVYEKPIVFHDRESGSSKMGMKVISEAFFKTLALRFKNLKKYRQTTGK